MRGGTGEPFSGKAFWAYSQMKEICAALEARFILFQSPVGFKPTATNARVMRNFFESVDRGELKFIWEPR